MFLHLFKNKALAKLQLCSPQKVLFGFIKMVGGKNILAKKKERKKERKKIKGLEKNSFQHIPKKSLLKHFYF